MHPAIILKTFDNELFVLPISSKSQKLWKNRKEYNDGKITLSEAEKKNLIL